MIARSLLDLLLTLFLVVTIVFFAVELVPGDPAEAALAQSTVSQEALQQRREALGLDRPVLVRYVDYLTGLLRGDAGRSWVTGQPAMVLVASQLGPTLNLVAAGMAAAVAGGLLLGLLSALVGPVARTLSGVALALPVMATGLILIWLFSVQAALFPASGQGSLSRLVLPAVTVAIPAAGAIARAADAGLTDARDAPFWHAVRSRGLPPLRAFGGHLLPVGLLPVLDIIALQTAFLIGGAVVTETLFARQGVGRVLLDAVLNKDLPVIQAAVIVTAGAVVGLNALADVLRTLLDPRVRQS